MKRIVKIEGLDCPNCARTLQNEINKIDGVKNGEIKFVKTKISFESEDVDKATKDIVNLTRKIEPNATIVLEKTNKNKKMLILDLVFLVLGVALGLISLLVSLPTWAFWIVFVASALLLGYKTYLKAVLLLFKGVELVKAENKSTASGAPGRRAYAKPYMSI